MRRSDKEKAELLETWKASGKSKTAWCKAQGISSITLNRWIEKLDIGKNDRKENETVFAEANLNFSGDPANFADEVRIRVPVKENFFEVYCTGEKSVLKNVLEAVAECL